MSTTLQNIQIKDTNIPMIFEQDHSLPIVSIQFTFQVAGSIEDDQTKGLAKLSAALLNEGTLKDGNIKFANMLESKAISLHASVGIETFVIEISSLKEHINTSIDLLIRLIKDPNFNEETLNKLKVLTLSSIARKEDNFDYIANTNLKKILFENSKLQDPQIGTPKSIKKIKLHDIKNFLQEHLTLSNAIVVLGGDINLDEAEKISKKVLTNFEVGTKRSLPFIKATSKTKNISISKETQQAYIYFGSKYNLKAGDEDTYKSQVASFILGSGGFGSRMMEEIRVKQGLAYSVTANTSLNMSHTYFHGHLQTKLSTESNASDSVKKVINDFVKNGVTQEELESAKKFILGSEPLRNETLSQRLNRAFFEYYRGFELGYNKKRLQNIKELSLKELNSFIKSHDEITNLSFSVVDKEI